MKVKENIAKKLGFVPAVQVEDLRNESEKMNKEFSEFRNTVDSRINGLLNARSFAGAQQTHLTSDWNEVYDTLSMSQYMGLRLMRQRSRDFAANDPWAKKYLHALKKNVIGPDGFTLRNKAMELIYDEAKKMKVPKYDKFANILIQDAWEDFCLPQFCTITEQISFRESCNQQIRTIATDGEILIKPIRDTNLKYGYTNQLIEADYLDETLNTELSNGNFIVMGVELTPFRKPVAYWLKKVNPYNQLFWGSYYSSEHVRIPVYDKNGLIQIKHQFVQEHPMQVRGIPWFAPSMIRLRMLSGYEEAILVDARVSANKGLKYEYNEGEIGEEINEANFGGEFLKKANGEKDPKTLIKPSMPGQDIVVPQGMKATVVDFKSPSGKEGEFQKWALRGIASGLDIAFITLANDYSDVNYTSSRTNLLEERDTWKELHAWFRDHFLNWNFAEWLRMALLTQAINLPYSKYDKFNKPWFQGRAWQWVSPKDEAEAILLLISEGAASFEEFLAERGWSLEAFIDQMKYENEAFEEAGLPFPGSTYKQAKPIDTTQESTTPKNGKAKAILVN